MSSYLAFKVVHILGVVLFLGNIIVTGVWKVLADRTLDPRTIAYAQNLVTLTDWIFTAGGVVLILIGAYGIVGRRPQSAGLCLSDQGPDPVHRLRHHLGGDSDPDTDRPSPRSARFRRRRP